jgi:pilus assembly protein CpaF
MSLRDRFRKQGTGPASPGTNGNGNPPNGNSHGGNGDGAKRTSIRGTATADRPARNTNDRHNGLKARVHRRMIERLNLASLDGVDESVLLDQIRRIVGDIVQEEGIPLTDTQREELEQEVLNETFGLGPIEPLLHDPDVADILVNGYRDVFVERFGKLERTDVEFDSDEHLMKFIDRIVSRVGRRVDESSPMVDARLPDGSRVNAIIPPLALDGPTLSIRRFGVRTLGMDDLLENNSISAGMVTLLQAVVKARLNCLVVGGTGSGKTTLLNALSASIPENERIITIEDAAELQLLQPHVVRLETRPANIEGKGRITQRELVRNALRMRPDRIVVGEVRGDEVLDMLQAMNTGHDGSMTTIHANSTRDALHRLETLMLLSGVNLPTTAMREQISAGLDVIVHVTRMVDGSRRLVGVSEIVGMERDVVSMQEIFRFKKVGLSEDGRVMGHYEATGIRPKFAERLFTSGVDLDPDIFFETRME